MSVEFRLKKKKKKKKKKSTKIYLSCAQTTSAVQNMEDAGDEGVLKELRWKPGCAEDFYPT
jgi:hypothetical protein